jgi:hypothetical protein
VTDADDRRRRQSISITRRRAEIDNCSPQSPRGLERQARSMLPSILESLQARTEGAVRIVESHACGPVRVPSRFNIRNFTDRTSPKVLRLKILNRPRTQPPLLVAFTRPESTL